jgi:hypothetical protein
VGRRTGTLRSAKRPSSACQRLDRGGAARARGSGLLASGGRAEVIAHEARDPFRKIVGLMRRASARSSGWTGCLANRSANICTTSASARLPIVRRRELALDGPYLVRQPEHVRCASASISEMAVPVPGAPGATSPMDILLARLESRN